jgi:predicted CXXCH cytochrome family protein
MNTLSQQLRGVLLISALVAPIAIVMAAAFCGQSQPVKAASKPQAIAFPLSLFAQAKPTDYIDEKKCATCHDRGISDNPMFVAYATFEPSPHRPFSENPSLPIDQRGCQGCHGPGGPHAANITADNAYDFVISYSRLTPEQTAMACLRCHSDTMTKDHWLRTEHARAGVACTSCHEIHQDGHPMEFDATGKAPKGPVFPAAADPTDLLKADQATLCGTCHQPQVNDFRRNFHHPVPEGRMVCSDCHGIHPSLAASVMESGAIPQAATASDSLKDVDVSCVRCHAEVAGPFVYEHDPVEGLTSQGCLDCHQPHGSQNADMLKLDSRGLCAQCHADKMVNHFPGQTCWQSGCHVGLHGSDHDPNLLSR